MLVLIHVFQAHFFARYRTWYGYWYELRHFKKIQATGTSIEKEFPYKMYH